MVLEELSLSVIDTGTKIEALEALEAVKAFPTDGKITDKEYIRKVSDAFGFDEEQYNSFARANIDIDIKGIDEEDLDQKTSVISRLDLSVFDHLAVKDLPEEIRLKLLSILRLQRKRKRRQMKALAKKKKTAGRDTEMERRDSQDRPGKVRGSGGSMGEISDEETGKFYISVATR